MIKETCLLRFSSALTFLFYSCTHQEEHVADGEAFEDVGEARLQLHALLGEHEHADDVSCDWSAFSAVQPIRTWQRCEVIEKMTSHTSGLICFWESIVTGRVAAAVRYEHTWAGIFKHSMRTRNRVGIGLSYRSARLHRLAELIHSNQFLGFLKVWKFGLWEFRTQSRLPTTDGLKILRTKHISKTTSRHLALPIHEKNKKSDSCGQLKNVLQKEKKLTENAEKSDNRHSNTLEKTKRSCLVTTFSYVPFLKWNFITWRAWWMWKISVPVHILPIVLSFLLFLLSFCLITWNAQIWRHQPAR